MSVSLDCHPASPYGPRMDVTEARRALDQVARALLADDLEGALWAARRVRSAHPCPAARALEDYATALHERGRRHLTVSERGHLLERLATAQTTLREADLITA